MLRAVLLVVALVATGIAAARPKWHELTHTYSYAQYLADFGKSAPATHEERHLREREFKNSLRKVLVHNADTTQLYKKGINHLSDWTDEERKQLRGAKVGQMEPLRQQLLAKPFVGKHEAPVTAGVLPPSLDYRLRLPAILTAVKDQGMCGSCWAHGSTETIESHYAIATGELFVLSQQQVTACAPNPQQCGGTGGCQGSIAELAFDYIATVGGQAQEWTYPYTAYQGTTGTCAAQLPALPVQITGYKKVASNSQAAVLDALVNAGPLAINVDASAWSDYESGIFTGCDYSKNISIDHVVQLVGYGTDRDLGQQYWIVRNSWSPAWAEQGYIKLLKQSTPACGWNVNPSQGTGCKGGPPQQWTCGMCGILFDTSYPTVQGAGKP